MATKLFNELPLCTECQVATNMIERNAQIMKNDRSVGYAVPIDNVSKHVS